ncbi:MAG: hypothetical protein O7G85_14705 [Planctomycetota bacterium]|nr:hypothetical protein [Planctomycetota bacterium]
MRLLLHADHIEEIPDSVGGFDTRPFTIRDLADRFPESDLERRRSIIPGNAIFPLLQEAEESAAEYLWLLEFDVRFGGKWSDLFDSFADSRSDFIGTTITRQVDRPDWHWWSSLRWPDADRPQVMIRGMLPIFRISRAAAQTVREAILTGWGGHCEVLLPTLIQHRGMSIEDIGGNGLFVKSGNYNRFYENTPGVAGLAPGTLVCPPANCRTQCRDGKIYHPVKT